MTLPKLSLTLTALLVYLACSRPPKPEPTSVAQSAPPEQAPCPVTAGSERPIEWKRPDQGAACPDEDSRGSTPAGGATGAADAGAAQSSGMAGNASLVLARLRAPITKCYLRNLAENPCDAGAMMVNLYVGCTGSVGEIRAAVKDLSDLTLGCVMEVLKGAQFAPPEGGRTNIRIPLSFVQPKPE
jgi:hypothetical protein